MNSIQQPGLALYSAGGFAGILDGTSNTVLVMRMAGGPAGSGHASTERRHGRGWR